MSLLLWVVTGIVVVGAALRSTWSPCGLSMLSTITPLAERARGRRYPVTAGWFMAGATLGGVALGTLGALGARIVDSLGLAVEDRVVIAMVAVAVAVGLDAGVVVPRLPHHRRQVNEVWLDQFRGWVYGLGFGVQIGFGLVTYIMTAGVYLVVVLGAAGASPGAAVALGALFGVSRGLALFAGIAVTTPERLVALHRRLESLAERSRHAMLTVEIAAALVFATQTARPAVAAASLVLVVLCVCAVSRTRNSVVVLPAAESARRSSVDLRSRASARSPLS